MGGVKCKRNSLLFTFLIDKVHIPDRKKKKKIKNQKEKKKKKKKTNKVHILDVILAILTEKPSIVTGNSGIFIPPMNRHKYSHQQQ